MRSTHLYTLIHVLVGGPAFKVAMVSSFLAAPTYIASVYVTGLGATGAALPNLLATLGLGLAAIAAIGIGLYLLLIHLAEAALGRRHTIDLIWPRTSHTLAAILDCIVHTLRAIITFSLSCIYVFRLVTASLLRFPAGWPYTPGHLSTKWTASSHPQLA